MIITVIAISMLSMLAESKKVHHIHWNKANPMFWRDNRDHILDVNVGNLPWEYDQVNIICPLDRTGGRYPEKHVIYSVSKEEYESCRITNPKPKIVAVCSQPSQLLYFTITFRTFSPMPGALEFKPGQDYYIISTSSREDLHRRVGGACATHNMRMIFRVADDNKVRSEVDDQVDDSFNIIEQEEVISDEPAIVFNAKNPYDRPYGKYYGYRPQELIQVTSNQVRNLPLTADVLTSSAAKINGQTSILALVLATTLAALLHHS